MDEEHIYRALADARQGRIDLMNAMIREFVGLLHEAISWASSESSEDRQRGLKALRNLSTAFNKYLYELDRA